MDDEAIDVPQRGEKNAKSGGLFSRSRRDPEKPRKPRKWWQVILWWGFLFCLFLGLAAAGTAFFYGHGYHTRASEVDIRDISALAEGALVLDSTGEQLGAISVKYRILVEREEIPHHLIQALLAAEDSRFFDHPGFDTMGMMRAAIANIRKKEIDQGASTITQQLARNSFELGGRSFDRKLLEIFVAHRIEQNFSKDDILVHYLNRIYLGNGFWGIGAAAQGYFGKVPAELTADESAMICGLIRSPNPLSPFKNPEAATLAKNRVLSRMVSEGFLTGEEEKSLREKNTKAVKNDGRNNQPRYLLAKVNEEAVRMLGERSLEGIEIQTSIDPSVQRTSELAIADQVEKIEASANGKFKHPTRADFHAGKIAMPEYLQGAAVVLENDTGRIISAVASRDMQESEYDRVGLSQRPVGTAFAPFVYAAAFESGVASPASPVFDAPIDNREVMLGGEEGVLGEWGSEGDATEYLGKVPAGAALIDGKNAATVRLGFEVGLDAVKDVAYRSGIFEELPGYPATFLGAGETTLLALTHAYTIFPNSGIRAGRTGFIDRIVDRDGKILYTRESDARRNRVRSISEEVASEISTLLSQSVMKRARSELAAKIKPLEGKIGGTTGTTFDFDNAWFVGFNSRYSWGVWMGMDRPATIYDEAFSRDLALPAWTEIATEVDTGQSLATDESGKVVMFCVDSGLRADPNCVAVGHRVLVLPVSAKDRLERICRLDKEDLPAGQREILPETRAKPITRENIANLPVIPDAPVFEGEDAFGILE